jgi:alpha-tubulin suppressor-like RCC1 family protein
MQRLHTDRGAAIKWCLVLGLLAVALFGASLASHDQQRASAAGVRVVAAGTVNTCSLASGGVRCWGDDNLGQLGKNNAGTMSAFPVAIAGWESGVYAVEGGIQFLCAVRRIPNDIHGTAECLGDNNNGELGDGQSCGAVFCQNSTQVSGLQNNTLWVAAGMGHACALTASFEIKCWGNNFFGQAGDGTSGNNKLTPVSVCGNPACSTSLISTLGYTIGGRGMALGRDHSCVRTLPDRVICWGLAEEGRLGNGTSSGIQVGQEVCSDATCTSPLTGLRALAAGTRHTCALMNTGTVKCWGANGLGQVGDGTSGNIRTTPVDVSGLSGVEQIAAGGEHTCARLTSGEVKCWGSNGVGELGDGTTFDRTSPVFVCADASCTGNLTGATSITAGGNLAGVNGHSCATLAADRSQCWGANNAGQLGDGTTTERHTPVDVLGPAKLVSLNPGLCPIGGSLPFPDPSCDSYFASTTFTANITDPAPVTLNCSAAGPVVAARYHNPFDPHDGDGDTLRDIDTELLYMNLQGLCQPGNLRITVRENPSLASLGQIEEQASGDPFFPADSYFDGFFEVDSLTVGRTIRNTTAAHSVCKISNIPPLGCGYTMDTGGGGGFAAFGGGGGIDLYDEDDMLIGELTAATLTPQVVDSDLDGCADARERGQTQQTGGRRSEFNFWDLFDTPQYNASPERDRTVSVGDISRTVARFGSSGAATTVADALLTPAPPPAYHAGLDRTDDPSSMEPWDLLGPNGSITVQDISLVVAQFGHNCL